MRRPLPRAFFLLFLAMPVIVVIALLAVPRQSPVDRNPPNLVRAATTPPFSQAEIYAMLDAGEYEELLPIMETLIPQSPTFAAEGHMLRATIYRMLGDDEAALAAANESVQADPDYQPGHIQRGLALYMLRDYEEAEAAFNEVLDLSPDYADAYYGRGLVHLARGDFRESRDDLNRAVELNPMNLDYRLARGWQRYQLINFRGALEDYQRALELDPDNPLAFGGIAYAYAALNECELARQAFDQHLALAGDAPDLNLGAYMDSRCPLSDASV